MQSRALCAFVEWVKFDKEKKKESEDEKINLPWIRSMFLMIKVNFKIML